MLFCQILLKLIRDEPTEYVLVAMKSSWVEVRMSEYLNDPDRILKMIVQIFANRQFQVDIKELKTIIDDVIDKYEVEKVDEIFNITL